MASRMIQNNFAGGEISPSLFGRSDLQAYYKGCANAENFVITKEGTLRKRHGISSFIQLVGSYDVSTIVPYRFDRSVAGFLLLTGKTTEVPGEGEDPATQRGDLEIKYYLKDGTLSDTKTAEGAIDISAGAPSISDQVKAIQSKQIGDQVWVTNGTMARVITITDSSTISVTEWQQAEVPDSIPHKPSSPTITQWAVVPDAARNGKVLYYGVIAVKDSVNSDTSKGSCKWSSSWAAGTYVDIKVTIAIEDKSKWDYVIAAKRSGGTYGELTRFYMDDTPDEYYYTNIALLAQCWKWSDGKYYDYEEGAVPSGKTPVEVTPTHHRYKFRDENHSPGDAVYGQTNVLGEGFDNPLCIDCFQQRRVFANASTDDGKKFPMTLWFSEVGNINNFYADRPTAEDDSFSPTISSTGPSFIRWIVTYDEMMVLFTDSGLFSVGFSQQSGFSSSSCRISRFSGLAVSPHIQPIVTDAGIVFVAADNKTIYTAAYDLQENKLKPINRSVLVEHLTRSSQVKSIALQEAPDSVVWAVTADGKANTFTFERNEEVYAWSHSSISGAQIVDVISLGSCTDPTDALPFERTYTDLVFVVKSGSGTYFIAKPNAGYKDSIGGVETNVKSTLTTLRPESQEKTIAGYKKNLKDVLVRLYKTGGIAVKSADGTDAQLVNGKLTLDAEGLFTGDVKVMPRGIVNDAGQMTLVSDNDKPCEILLIVSSLEVE